MTLVEDVKMFQSRADKSLEFARTELGERQGQKPHANKAME